MSEMTMGQNNTAVPFSSADGPLGKAQAVLPQPLAPHSPATLGIVLPDLNRDQEIHRMAATAGAYAGATVAAGITGLFSLGRGVMAGIKAGIDSNRR